MRSSTLYCACSLAFSVACGMSALWATGCSSSSSGSPTPHPTGDDMDGSVESDGGSLQDGTLPIGDSGNGGDDVSSPHDAGKSPDAATVNATSAGEAGATRFCGAVCDGLLACAADAGPCHCTPGSAALERTDFVDAFTSCVKGAIIADCSDAGGAVEDCQVSAAAAVVPTTAASTFCHNLDFTLCATTLPDCLTNAGIYSDTTIAAFANCFSELPDADVDGGCTNFANCLGTASNP